MRTIARIVLCATALALSLWGCRGESRHAEAPRHSRVWLRCEANDWQRSPDWEFVDTGGGRYVLYDKDLYLDFIIDVKSAGKWNFPIWGGNSSDSLIVPNRPYRLARQWGRHVQLGYQVIHCDSIVFLADSSQNATSSHITLHASQPARAFTRLQDTPTHQHAVHHIRTGEPRQVLALGNSLTAYHHQDSMFNTIARQSGIDARWTSHCLGGASLATHWNGDAGTEGVACPSAHWLVCSRPWTHIVLQEQSLKPLYDPEGFAASVHRWVEFIRDLCPNHEVEILLVVNFPRATLWNDYARIQQIISHNSLVVAHREGIRLSPIGTAYSLLCAASGPEETLTLYSDERHPSLAATYMAACIEMALVGGTPPHSIVWHPEALSDHEAQRMRLLAEEALRQ